MLEASVRLATRRSNASMSGRADGRLAADLGGYVTRLKRLAQDDPNDEFWEILQRALVKLVRFVCRGGR